MFPVKKTPEIQSTVLHFGSSVILISTIKLVFYIQPVNGETNFLQKVSHFPFHRKQSQKQSNSISYPQSHHKKNVTSFLIVIFLLFCKQSYEELYKILLLCLNSFPFLNMPKLLNPSHAHYSFCILFEKTVFASSLKYRK